MIKAGNKQGTQDEGEAFSLPFFCYILGNAAVLFYQRIDLSIFRKKKQKSRVKTENFRGEICEKGRNGVMNLVFGDFCVIIKGKSRQLQIMMADKPS